MGINNKGSWFDVIAANKDAERRRLKQGLTPRFPEPEVFSDIGNIKSSKHAEEMIQARCCKRDERGRELVSSARGRRRREKLGERQ